MKCNKNIIYDEGVKRKNYEWVGFETFFFCGFWKYKGEMFLFLAILLNGNSKNTKSQTLIRVMRETISE